MITRKQFLALAGLIVAPFMMAQVSGPTIFTPRLTVGNGTRAGANELRVNGNATITGTCTGCAASVPGSNTQVIFNDGGSLGADAGLTYNKTTDALTVAGALSVASCSGCGGGGATITVGTFSVTYPICCTTTPTQNWAYVKASDGVNAFATIYPTDQASGTGDSTNFSNSGGTQIPSGLRPLQEAVFNTNAANNGTNGSAVIRFGTTGAVNLGNSAFDYNAAWTASGTREFPATNLGFPVFTYRVAP